MAILTRMVAWPPHLSTEHTGDAGHEREVADGLRQTSAAELRHGPARSREITVGGTYLVESVGGGLRDVSQKGSEAAAQAETQASA